jgi:deltex-like protein
MDALGVPQDALTCRQWILQQQRQQQQQQRQQQQLQGYRTAGHDLSVVRQETIYYMAPLQWNASDQFSKYLETVSAPPGNSRLEKQGVNQQPHPQSSLARAAAALSPSSLPGNLSNGNWLSSGNWVSSFAPSGTIVYPGNTCNAPISFNNQHLQSVSNVTAQDPTNQTESAAADGKGEDDECPICLDVLFDLENTLSQSHSVVRLKSCKHLFHRQCILDSLNQHHDKCPSCRDPIGVEPNGKGPSGSMTITLDKVRPCPGFSDSDGVISIYYNMPMGVQAPYMEHPGQRYSGTARQAYLPHNTEGRRLLNRLRYAFRHGLCFRVGTSLTTGLPNQITWTSIHHKTSLHGGVHGFPDPNYMKNCNDSLDALHVPAAEDCS